VHYTEIETEEALRSLLASTSSIEQVAFQNMDLSIVPRDGSVRFDDCIFMGCVLPLELYEQHCTECHIFPQMDVPFNMFPPQLYTSADLYGGYEVGKPGTYENCLDSRVYTHYIKMGKEAGSIKETLARRLHDHSVTDALYGFLESYESTRVVAIMGGHSLLRDDAMFTTVARLSKRLTESGYLMISGGGPGAMEATHVGAWFADRDDKELLNAIALLSKAPSYEDALWLDAAFEVQSIYPRSAYESVGIPTWLYGHEPPTPFATKIAKYFANSVREDGLLAIAKGGVIFSPGSAGTIQEIFQDATQNHYLSFGIASPMVFLDSHYWTVERPVYPLLKTMDDEGKYQNMILSLYDHEEEVFAEIRRFTEKCVATDE
jgi:predicted Rossmann-fold nucleotide-binding protein